MLCRWDYGYQITAMGNRTIIVDNNTWNNTHIATVGRAMASNETEAYKWVVRGHTPGALVFFMLFASCHSALGMRGWYPAVTFEETEIKRY